ncbi:MAG: hypothetical protein FJ077_11980 [Cyanobacteria bacterium K_DeepCast_35m_m2_023]|nr:hypothetical protein [Cyanobacteria bacterium K_DeepCast_35m_m2_023]
MVTLANGLTITSSNDPITIGASNSLSLAGEIKTNRGVITIDNGNNAATAITLTHLVALNSTNEGPYGVNPLLQGADISIKATIGGGISNNLWIQAGNSGDVSLSGTTASIASLFIAGNDINLASVDGIGGLFVQALDAASPSTDSGSLTLTGNTYRITGHGSIELDSGSITNPITLAGPNSAATLFQTTGCFTLTCTDPPTDPPTITPKGLVELSGQLNLNGRSLVIDTTNNGASPQGGLHIRLNNSIDGPVSLSLNGGTKGFVGLNDIGGITGSQSAPLTDITLVNAKEAVLVRDLWAGSLHLLKATYDSTGHLE